MKCPNCGADVGRNPFCPQCGADMTSRVRSRVRLLRNLDRGVRQGVAAAIVFVAFMSVLVVIISAIPSQDVPEPEPGPDVPPEGSLILDADTYIVLSGGFSDGSLSAALSGSKTPVITIADEFSEGCDTFRWDFRNSTLGFSWTMTKELPTLEWIEPAPGMWTVTVYCYSQGELASTLTGGMAYHGSSTHTYTWEHSGKTLSVTYTVTMAQFEATVSGDRTSDSLESGAGFVDAGAVSVFESKVWAAYSAAFPGVSRTSSDYATCLMDMLSQHISEQSDLITYGQAFYWATPLQTLYLGAGDSSDQAVLAASVLKAAGFTVGVVKLPDEWSVAIGRVMASTATVPGFAVLSAEMGDTRVYVCDVSGFLGIGLMPLRYGYDSGFTYCGEPVSSGFGVLEC